VAGIFRRVDQMGLLMVRNGVRPRNGTSTRIQHLLIGKSSRMADHAESDQAVAVSIFVRAFGRSLVANISFTKILIDSATALRSALVGKAGIGDEILALNAARDRALPSS